LNHDYAQLTNVGDVITLILLVAFTFNALYLAGKPLAPRGLRVTEVYKDHVSLAWDEPDSDGGSPITNYVIEKKDAAKTNWISAGQSETETLAFKVTKLFEGTKYDFRVAAENKIGIGEYVELDESVTAKLPFGKFSFMFFAVLFCKHMWAMTVM